MAFITYAPLPVIYTKPEISNPDLFKDFAGLYRESPTVTDTISIAGGHVYLAPTGSEKTELVPLNDSAFISEGYFGNTVFSRNAKGVVTHNYYEFPDGQRLVFTKIK